MRALRVVTPLPQTDWDPQLAHVCADMNNAPLNVHKLMAHSPDLLAAWWNFRNYSVQGGTLGPHLGELVILRAGMHLGNWYEWASHVDRAIRAGMSAETIAGIMFPDVSNIVPELDRLSLIAVDDLMRFRSVSPNTRAALEAHLSTAQILDLIAIHGMYMTLGAMIETWGLELDDDVAQRVAAHTSKEEFLKASMRFQAT